MNVRTNSWDCCSGGDTALSREIFARYDAAEKVNRHMAWVSFWNRFWNRCSFRMTADHF